MRSRLPRTVHRATGRIGFWQHLWINVKSNLLAYIVLIIFSVFALYPLFWMISSSFKSLGDFLVNRWLLPRKFTLKNYIDAWKKIRLYTFFFNSVIVTGASVVLMVSVGSMAGYAIARFDFRGRDGVLYYFIGGQVIPAIIALIPLIILLKSLGLMNTHLGIILVYIGGGLPFTVFMLQGFFKTIPRELEDAARIDGAGEMLTFIRIMLPMARPALATLIIFQSMWVWNEFLFAFVFLRSKELRTLTVAVFSVMGQWSTNFPLLFAGLSISTMPIIVLYVLASKQLIKGITAGAVKG